MLLLFRIQDKKKIKEKKSPLFTVKKGGGDKCGWGWGEGRAGESKKNDGVRNYEAVIIIIIIILFYLFIISARYLNERDSIYQILYMIPVELIKMSSKFLIF